MGIQKSIQKLKTSRIPTILSGLILTSLFLSYDGFAQTPAIDSLKKALESIPAGREYWMAKLNLANRIGVKDTLVSYQYIRETIKESKGKDDSIHIRSVINLSELDRLNKKNSEFWIDSLNRMVSRIKNDHFKELKNAAIVQIGSIYSNSLQKPEEALPYFNRVINSYSPQPDSNNIYAISLLFKAICHMALDSIPQSIEGYYALDDYCTAFNFVQYRFFAYNNLSTLYTRIGDNKSSLELKRKAMALCPEDDFRYPVIAKGYANLLVAEKEFSEALRVGQTVISKDKIKDDIRAECYGIMAEAYIGIEKLDSAVYYLTLAENLLEKTADSSALLNLEGQWGLLFYKKDNLKDASQHFEKALSYYTDTPFKEDYVAYHTILEYYLLAYSKMNSPVLADKMVEYISSRDSLRDTDTKNIIIQQEIKYQTTKKELENTNLRQRNELQSAQIEAKNYQLGFAGLGSLALLMLIGLLYQRYKERNRANEMLELKNQRIQTLNREIIHRTKNQLEMAANLISAYQTKGGDHNRKDWIEESESRMRALNSVNRRLTVDNDYTRTNLRETLLDILQGNIFSFSGKLNKEVSLQMEMPDIYVDAERAAIIGLVINELSVNSLKHAFGQNEEPVISLKARQNGILEIVYADSGTGPSTNHQEPGHQGQSLLLDLLRQIEATYQINDTSKYQWTIQIPNTHEQQS